MSKRWRLVPHDLGLVEDIATQSNLPPFLAQLLLRRGLTQSDQIAHFLDPKLTDLRDPEQLPGIIQAAETLYQAVLDNKSIVIYGDYDADGMTSTAILLGALKLMGAQVTYFVPNRLEDGYGLNRAAISKLAETGKQVVVTVDCGIAAIDEAQLARELGLQLIITDHHQMGSTLPVADAIVHPALPGHHYPFHGLCGAGVAFKLAWALCQRASQAKRVSPEFRNYLLSAIGLAAIGTVADVVPLIDENRVIVKHGLKALKANPCLGLQQLMQITKLDAKPQLDSDSIAFTLAPRLNAAGRLGQAQLGVELLSTTDVERAKVLAAYVDKLNGDRETLERSIQVAAGKQIKEQFNLETDPALVLAAPGWHAGVIGVVAGRLAEKHHLPVVVISLDQLGQKPGIGSGRSPKYLNLHEAFHACREYLVSCGGHAAAAGLKIEERNVAAFRQAFFEYVSVHTNAQSIQPELTIDAEAPLGMLNLEAVRQIEAMAPFGQENPRPLLCACGVSLAGPAKTMGATNLHFTANFKQHGRQLRAVAFGQADWVAQMQDTEQLFDIAFRPVINDFRGIPQVEIQLVDWRLHQAMTQSTELDVKEPATVASERADEIASPHFLRREAPVATQESTAAPTVSRKTVE